MLISTLIARLEEIKKEHGNLPCYRRSYKNLIDIHHMDTTDILAANKKIQTGKERSLKMWLPKDDEKLIDTKVLIIK